MSGVGGPQVLEAVAHFGDVATEDAGSSGRLAWPCLHHSPLHTGYFTLQSRHRLGELCQSVTQVWGVGVDMGDLSEGESALVHFYPQHNPRGGYAGGSCGRKTGGSEGLLLGCWPGEQAPSVVDDSAGWCGSEIPRRNLLWTREGVTSHRDRNF